MAQHGPGCAVDGPGPGPPPDLPKTSTGKVMRREIKDLDA